ncbi:hypothetical protein [Methylocystis hirsuta]|uniref:hypothetical protein n=1 Tax=Methylocystis hirsuta TaxID=369798 RepID=UPI0011CE839C|nr:hypothetical protein [Methylocystis hirsuta]
MDMSDQSFRSFSRAIWGDWLARMSGPASVPAAILTVYADDWWARIAFGLTMFACAWFAAYRIWVSEHERVVSLEIKLDEKRSADDLRRILGEIFDEAQKLCGAVISDGYGEENWRSDIEALMQKTHDSLNGKISDIELNVLLFAPMGQKLLFIERKTENQDRLQHFIHYFRERLMHLIDKL